MGGLFDDEQDRFGPFRKRRKEACGGQVDWRLSAGVRSGRPRSVLLLRRPADACGDRSLGGRAQRFRGVRRMAPRNRGGKRRFACLGLGLLVARKIKRVLRRYGLREGATQPSDGGPALSCVFCYGRRSGLGANRTPAPESGSRPPVKLDSTITCPICGFRSVERMPTNACVHFYECKDCGALMRPEAGDCCVFCSYGDLPCPPLQIERAESDCCSSGRRDPDAT